MSKHQQLIQQQVNQGTPAKSIKSVQFLKAFYLGNQSYEKLDVIKQDCTITETNNQLIIVKLGITYKVPTAFCFIEYA